MPKPKKKSAASKAAGPVASQQPTSEADMSWPDSAPFNMATDPGIDAIVDEMMGGAPDAMPPVDEPGTGDQAPEVDESTSRAAGGDEEEEPSGAEGKDESQAAGGTTQAGEAQAEAGEAQAEAGEAEAGEAQAGEGDEESDLPEDFGELFPDLVEASQDVEPTSSNVQKRIDTLTARLKDSERRNEELQAQVNGRREEEVETEEIGANLGFESQEAKKFTKKEASAKNNIKNARDLMRQLNRGNIEKVVEVFKSAKIPVDDYEEGTLRDAIQDYLDDYTEQYTEARINRIASQRDFQAAQRQQQDEFTRHAAQLYPWMTDKEDPRYRLAADILAARPYMKKDPAWPVMLGSYTLTYIDLKRINRANGQATPEPGKKKLKPLKRKGIRPSAKPAAAGARSSGEGDRFAAASARVLQEPTDENLTAYVGALIGEP